MPAGPSPAPAHAVVLGGTGYVGSHVVRRLLDAGTARVTVPTRRESGLPDWGPRADAVRTVHLDVSTAAGSADLARSLAQAPPVDLALASIGGWWEGDRLVDLPPATWDELMASHVTAHWLAARAVVPHLADDGVYVAMNGIATLQPEARSGPVSVSGAAQTMLLDVLRVEEERAGVRFHELCVVNPIVDDGQAASADEAVVEIGEVAARVLEVAGTDPGTLRVRLGTV